MATTGTAVPGNVNLSRQKPYAVSAYSRRVKSLANNAQAFGPDSYVNITLDTSTPGSFLDPLQSYLKFDVVIRNSNVFADFISFGASGAASLIEEFRIYVQGTPIEEILQYNVFYELAMNQNGQCQQPFHMFRQSSVTQGISSIFHTSAIKAPMTDMDGRPMFGESRQCPSQSTSARGVSWAYPIDATNNDTTNPKFLGAQMIGSQASVGTRLCFSGCRPFFEGTQNSTNKIAIADPHALIWGCNTTTTTGAGVGDVDVTLSTAATNGLLMPGYYRAPNPANVAVTPDGQILNLPTTTQTVPSDRSATGRLTGSVGQCGLDFEQMHYVNATGGARTQFTNYLSQKSGIMPYAGSTVEFPSIFTSSGAGQTGTWLDPDFDPRNPLNWCAMLPITEIRPDVRVLGPDNLQDYFMFLSNTKYIPIGMPGRNKYDAGSYATTITPSGFQTFGSNNFRNLLEYRGTDAANGREYIYTCCIPLISGVLGSFADKCWPTMLVAPGSMYIQIRTATAAKAFQLSMDPCRRVLGTVRDYLPFGGSMGGVFGQFGNTSIGVTVGGRGNLAMGSEFFNTDTSNIATASTAIGYLPRNTFTDYTGPKKIDLSATQCSVVANPNKVHSYLNGFGCIGASLLSANQYMTNKYINPTDTATKGAALMFRPFGVAALEGRWTIGKAYVSQFTGTVAGDFMQATEEGMKILPAPDANGNPGQGTNLTPDASFAWANGGVSAPATGSIVSATGLSGNAAAGGQGATQRLQGDVQVEFTPAGIPLPQYVLHARPWERKEFFCHINATKQYVFSGAIQSDIAHEASACYGTFLSASVPQCRRVFTNNSENGTTTYILQNIEFVSQQIILPDSVSASILEDAAQGDISITSNSVHNYQTPISQSNSQNLIIPAKIASANTMYCLFVPQAYVSGNEAYLYNSLRGICPFGSVHTRTSALSKNGLLDAYDTSIAALGVADNDLEVINIQCSQGAFQVQLKVGNELIPQQPLTTITELVAENVKAQHKLFDTRSNINATMNLTTTLRRTFGTAYTDGLAFDVIRGGGFCTTFISAAFCDDQTAINAPATAYAYACEANRVGSGTQKGLYDYVLRRLPNQMELFQPPESTFCLAFDMDTWSRVSDVARSGKYLGNNTITLNLQNALALGDSSTNTGSGGYTLQTFVVHDIRFSFQAGGSVVSYY